jgi:hypothetical protein
MARAPTTVVESSAACWLPRRRTWGQLPEEGGRQHGVGTKWNADLGGPDFMARIGVAPAVRAVLGGYAMTQPPDRGR